MKPYNYRAKILTNAASQTRKIKLKREFRIDKFGQWNCQFQYFSITMIIDPGRHPIWIHWKSDLPWSQCNYANFCKLLNQIKLTLSLPSYHCRQRKSWLVYACLVAKGLINLFLKQESITWEFTNQFSFFLKFWQSLGISIGIKIISYGFITVKLKTKPIKFKNT